jgi:phosphoribosylformylglycinamidine synthase
LLYTYRRPALSEAKKNNLLLLVREKASGEVSDIETEHCFYIETTDALNPDEISLLRWLLSETFEPENYSGESFLTPHSSLVTRHCLMTA